MGPRGSRPGGPSRWRRSIPVERPFDHYLVSEDGCEVGVRPVLLDARQDRCRLVGVARGPPGSDGSDRRGDRHREREASDPCPLCSWFGKIQSLLPGQGGYVFGASSHSTAWIIARHCYMRALNAASVCAVLTRVNSTLTVGELIAGALAVQGPRGRRDATLSPRGCCPSRRSSTGRDCWRHNSRAPVYFVRPSRQFQGSRRPCGGWTGADGVTVLLL